MNKRAVDKYVEEEVQKGKSHQEIFNYIAANSDFDIHDIASVVRKIPVLGKRKRYQTANYILVSILGLSIGAKLLSWLGITSQGAYTSNGISIIQILIPVILFYGLLTFKRNFHLIVGMLFLIGSLWAIIIFFINADLVSLLDVFTSVFASVLALFLNTKLSSDYRLNRDMLKENPELRVDVLTFID